MITHTSLPNLIHRGKVRDTYDLGHGLMLMVATDRISAFDVVLPNGIPNKGLVLSRMSAFWFQKTTHIVDNHLVGLADDPNMLAEYPGATLPGGIPQEIARQSSIVRRAERIDVECIVRGYIAGSAWSEYKKFGTMLGRKLPTGLKEGQELPEPVFTPTTKAEEGHDENMTLEQVADMVGSDLARKLENTSIAVYRYAHNYARDRGIILADTKMEFGILDGNLILIDELLTPDSSRFWDVRGYVPGESLPNFDKQFVRDWLTAQNWNREPPAPELPADIVERTTERYMEAYRMLTGQEISIS